MAQCYYLDFDDKNRNRPIYVYLNSTGCINEKGQAISADNEFYAIWAALGFTRAPLYTGVTWKAQNQVRARESIHVHSLVMLAAATSTSAAATSTTVLLAAAKGQRCDCSSGE